MTVRQVPVIGLTGYLGAGKTTLLNHLLARPGARIGVVINDFGAINVDAALVSGQVDEAASIAGGCLCCLTDAGGLDDALERLTRPRLRLDAVIIEASGAAEPLALARLIRFSGAAHARPGGMVDVVDALEHRHTVDTGALPPMRYQAASLVVINKADRVPAGEREEALEALATRIRASNPDVPILTAERGRIDPSLVFDAASDEDPVDELPLAALARVDGAAAHEHAVAVTVPATAPVEAGAVIDLLESPPAGVYRIKGCVSIRTRHRARRYLVNVVGHQVHVAPAPEPGPSGGLVAIGMRFDAAVVRARLEVALRASVRNTTSAAGFRRLQRHRRLSE
ncbi:GTP-binding protein [Aeromicrobium sp. YIM 150415]|uniref:CobW family GTP-binding protein n=1 Tax=Aeromicrobium sp. YIM 150415 TaxID=2803912 RepID=UPI0027DCEDEC|nr:GTP-binding protein [Aeromicrobium sp. YIM 150415]